MNTRRVFLVAVLVCLALNAPAVAMASTRDHKPPKQHSCVAQTMDYFDKVATTLGFDGLKGFAKSLHISMEEIRRAVAAGCAGS